LGQRQKAEENEERGHFAFLLPSGRRGLRRPTSLVLILGIAISSLFESFVAETTAPFCDFGSPRQNVVQEIRIGR